MRPRWREGPRSTNSCKAEGWQGSVVTRTGTGPSHRPASAGSHATPLEQTGKLRLRGQAAFFESHGREKEQPGL